MKYVYSLSFIAGFSLLFGIYQKEASQSASVERMQQFRLVLMELLPDVFSDERFHSPSNFERIEKNTAKLADLAHDMPKELASGKDQTTIDSDPSLSFITGLFREEILRALSSLRSGQRAYARSVLKAVPGYCIACHTRSTGFDFSSLNDEASVVFQSSVERGEYFNATRQFDRALDEFEKAVDELSTAKHAALQWERATRPAIVITVRVKRDPARARQFVEKVLASASAPVFLKEDARHWLFSLNDWIKERRTSKEDSFVEAKRLIDQAKKLQEYPADRSADIFYLRASAFLHDFLSEHSDSPNAGEALFLLGVCYETLQDLQLWSLHLLYYEACIRELPHTPLAQSCYARYERSVVFGFSGSSGLFLPSDIQQQLQELKSLAIP